MKDLICYFFGHKYIEIMRDTEGFDFFHYYVCGRCLHKKKESAWKAYFDGNTHITLEDQQQ